MEFKIRQSNTFIMNMFMILLALAMAVFCFLHHNFKYRFFHYSYILWLVIALSRWIVYRPYIYLMVKAKPVLIVNDVFVDDRARGIKYYWNDIEEIYEDNGYLFISLYQPVDYFAKINNPVKRYLTKLLYKPGSSPTPYKINIDMINVSPDALLQLLDDYSLQALNKEATS